MMKIVRSAYGSQRVHITLLAIFVCSGLACEFLPHIHHQQIGKCGIVLFCAFLLVVSAILHECDLVYQRHVGGHLTFDVATSSLTASAANMVTDNLRADLMFTLTRLLVVCACVFVVCKLVCVHLASRASKPTARPRLSLMLLALFAMVAVVRVNLHNFAPLATPVEVIWLNYLLGSSRTPPPKNETAQIENLRLLPLPPGREFVSRLYPAVHASVDASQFLGTHCDSANGDIARPDILLLAVESLAGRTLYNQFSPQLETPNLDRFVEEGVSFVDVTSPGIPTREGFFALHCSHIPHLQLVNSFAFTSTDFDCLPTRLKQLHNYSTIFRSACDPSIDNENAWASRPTWYDSMNYKPIATDPTLSAQDDVFYPFVLNDIEQYYSSGNSKPLFMYAATYSTHVPFRLHSNHPHSYAEALKFADDELGKFIANLRALAESKNRPPPVVIITGDHGPGDSRQRVTTQVVMLHLPHHIVARFPPGSKLQFPVSLVDIPVTILAMLCDNHPTAMLGRDVFRDDLVQHMAVSKCLERDKPVLWHRHDTNNAYCPLLDKATEITSGRVFVAKDSIGDGCDANFPFVPNTLDYYSYLSFLKEQNRIWNPLFLINGCAGSSCDRTGSTNTTPILTTLIAISCLCACFAVSRWLVRRNLGWYHDIALLPQNAVEERIALVSA